jgi:hypothetical protein
LRRHQLGALLAITSLCAAGQAEEGPFSIQVIQAEGRTIQANLVDLDGDGHGDLLWTSSEGLPPDEKRTLHVHFGAADGTIPESSDWTRPLERGIAAYDLAELDDRPGVELLLLLRDGVSVLSLHDRTPRLRELPVPAGPTIAVTQDERGMDRLALARAGLGASQRLLVPGLGHATLLEVSGETVATLDVGARANFFVPPRPGPIISESEIEIYLDHPRLSAGDVNGDGRGDLLASDRHELRVFLQREGGGFESRPDRSIVLGRLSETDHIRSSGSVRVEPYDFDGDGRADLLLSSTAGSLFGGTTELTLYRNIGGTWNLDQPDQRFEAEGGFSTHDLLDLDGDGRAELVSMRIPTGVLEIVEMLVTRAVDAEIKVYRRDGDEPFRKKAWFTLKQGVGISFETLRSKGFVPTAHGDFDGDGRRDLLGSGNGERLELRVGDPERGFEKKAETQELDTGGRIRFGDLDGDARDDFVLYDPRRPGTAIRVGRSRLGTSISSSP